LTSTRKWIDEHINDLNEFRQDYLNKVHKLEGTFEYFSYSKDMTGYKLTVNQGTEIGKRMKEKEFESYLEFTKDTLKELWRNKK